MQPLPRSATLSNNDSPIYYDIPSVEVRTDQTAGLVTSS